MVPRSPGGVDGRLAARGHITQTTGTISAARHRHCAFAATLAFVLSHLPIIEASPGRVMRSPLRRPRCRVFRMNRTILQDHHTELVSLRSYRKLTGSSEDRCSSVSQRHGYTDAKLTPHPKHQKSRTAQCNRAIPSKWVGSLG